jgi:hypothetical protein
MSRKSERRAPSLGEAIRWLLGGIPSDSLAPTRFYLEAYHGKELDFTDPFLLDLLNVEFGLTRAQAGTLTPPQLGFLLRHKYHLKTAPTQEDRQRVLSEVADVRLKIGRLPDSAKASTEAFLAALSTFPRPRTVLRQSAPEIPENAIRCSQAQVARFLKQAEHGGLVESLEQQGMLDWQGRIGTKLWVVFRNPRDHQQFREFVEGEHASRRQRTGKRRNVE